VVEVLHKQEVILLLQHKQELEEMELQMIFQEVLQFMQVVVEVELIMELLDLEEQGEVEEVENAIVLKHLE
jgi:hypothetical protein